MVRLLSEAARGSGCVASDGAHLDLTSAQLAAAPVLAGSDGLLIEDLTDNEDDAFAAALRS